MKISEAFSEYTRIEIQGRGCSLKTYEGVKYTERVVLQFFGDVNIRKIDAKRVNEFYLDLTTNFNRKTGKNKLVTNNTARGYIVILRAVIKYCDRAGVKTAPPEQIIIPKREKKQANFIDVQQFNLLMEELGKPKKGYAKINRVRNQLIAKMLFYTGLRVSELCALNRDSIRNKEFTVVGKSKYPRPCFITKEIERDIDNYLELRRDNEPALFIANETGKRISPSTIQRVFRLATKNARLTNVTPHTMRHSFATRLIDDQVDIRLVAALLGHQDLNTTKQYTHIKDYRLRQVYENAMERY